MLSKKISELIELGDDCTDYAPYYNWKLRVFNFLKTAVGVDVADDFSTLTGQYRDDWPEDLSRQIGFLEGYQLKLDLNSESLHNHTTEPINAGKPIDVKTKKVFIVHGHDNEVKESVARFVEKLKLEPIILHEQPNKGRTIIEKFEVFSDVGFAIILLTPDDVGSAKDNEKILSKRARQNVILELGYFLGKLGRNRVCALHKKGVEIPSDYQGVIYTEIDQAGAWKTKLAQELIEAGFSINLEAIIRH